ncbi:hypothetical protein [Uliginosibacterium flavum]|uniref:FAE domain-containing protein n=1 Tax=Uliginosibacterium flavum TaxID=1396831 RepID=A0ABV2TJX0_9RHOO
MAAEAGERALKNAGLEATEIDAVIVSTCTGYLCPGLSGYVIELLGLRPDVRAFDLVGQGCAAALPNFQLGEFLILVCCSGKLPGNKKPYHPRGIRSFRIAVRMPRRTIAPRVPRAFSDCSPWRIR